jgi:hypothetical protein
MFKYFPSHANSDQRYKKKGIEMMKDKADALALKVVKAREMTRPRV